MKKFLLTVIAVAAFAWLPAQNFTRLDEASRAFLKDDYPNPKDLSVALTKNLKTDLEKYRAIFTWVACNIRYSIARKEQIESGELPAKRIAGTTDDQIQEQLREAELKAVLRTWRTGSGVCDDYSNLYRYMCESVGLRCRLIKGKGRQLGGKFDVPHAWNAIWLNDTWHLIDVTWAAGGFERSGEHFKFNFSPAYFMTEPRLFALNHFPEDEQWQLFQPPLNLEEANRQVNVFYSNNYYPITDFQLALSDNRETAEIRFKFLDAVPNAIALIEGNDSRPISVAYKRSEENGFVILRFQPASKFIRVAFPLPDGKRSIIIATVDLK